MKKITKLMVLLLTLCMVFTQTQLPIKANDMQTKLQIGDYVQFGHYNGNSILWRVINKDHNGNSMLLSEKILCLKAFDAAESGINGKTGGSYTTNTERQKWGNNNWENSNLREWLNSSDRNVKYSTQPPTKDAVQDGNPYDNEAGFLSNFSQDEQAAIMSTTHKSLLADVEKDQKDGGTENFKYGYKIATIVQNYDNAYYKNVTDKVFLLDVKELHDYLYDRGWIYRRMPTTEAVKNSDYKNSNLSDDKYWGFWLCTPYSAYSYLDMIVTKVGSYYFYCPQGGVNGVLPSLNLKAGIITSGGDGTLGNPYIVVGVQATAPTPMPTLKNAILPAAPVVNVVSDIDKTLTGKAEVLATVQVKKGSIILGSVKASSNGSFSIAIKKQKAGTVLVVTAKDTSGNESNPTVVTVKDKTPPVVPVVNVIKSISKTVIGKAEVGALVTIKKGVSVIGSGYVKSNGTFTISITTQKAGTILYINAKDKAGNVSTACKVVVVK